MSRRTHNAPTVKELNQQFLLAFWYFSMRGAEGIREAVLGSLSKTDLSMDVLRAFETEFSPEGALLELDKSREMSPKLHENVRRANAKKSRIGRNITLTDRQTHLLFDIAFAADFIVALRNTPLDEQGSTVASANNLSERVLPTWFSQSAPLSSADIDFPAPNYVPTENLQHFLAQQIVRPMVNAEGDVEKVAAFFTRSSQKIMNSLDNCFQQLKSNLQAQYPDFLNTNLSTLILAHDIIVLKLLEKYSLRELSETEMNAVLAAYRAEMQTEIAKCLLGPASSHESTGDKKKDKEIELRFLLSFCYFALQGKDGIEKIVRDHSDCYPSIADFESAFPRGEYQPVLEDQDQIGQSRNQHYARTINGFHERPILIFSNVVNELSGRQKVILEVLFKTTNSLVIEQMFRQTQAGDQTTAEATGKQLTAQVEVVSRNLLGRIFSNYDAGNVGFSESGYELSRDFQDVVASNILVLLGASEDELSASQVRRFADQVTTCVDALSQCHREVLQQFHLFCQSLQFTEEEKRQLTVEITRLHQRIVLQTMSFTFNFDRDDKQLDIAGIAKAHYFTEMNHAKARTQFTINRKYVESDEFKRSTGDVVIDLRLLKNFIDRYQKEAVKNFFTNLYPYLSPENKRRAISLISAEAENLVYVKQRQELHSECMAIVQGKVKKEIDGYTTTYSQMSQLQQIKHGNTLRSTSSKVGLSALYVIGIAAQVLGILILVGAVATIPIFGIGAVGLPFGLGLLAGGTALCAATGAAHGLSNIKKADRDFKTKIADAIYYEPEKELPIESKIDIPKIPEFKATVHEMRTQLDPNLQGQIPPKPKSALRQSDSRRRVVVVSDPDPAVSLSQNPNALMPKRREVFEFKILEVSHPEYDVEGRLLPAKAEEAALCVDENKPKLQPRA